MHSDRSSFIDGEVLKQENDLNTDRVRGDHISWVDGSYSECPALKILCKKLDKLVDLCCKTLGYVVESRTKVSSAACVCYSGK